MSPTRRDILKAMTLGSAAALIPESPATAQENHDTLALPMVITFMNPNGRDVIATVMATIDRPGVATLRITNRNCGVPEQTHTTTAPAVRELMGWLASAQETIGTAIEQDREGYMQRVREETWRPSLARHAEREARAERAPDGTNGTDGSGIDMDTLRVVPAGPGVERGRDQGTRPDRWLGRR
ncbi:MAG: hypothetical protein WBA63_04975 [Thermomicrobiales bacterium]